MGGILKIYMSEGKKIMVKYRGGGEGEGEGEGFFLSRL